MKDPIAYLDPFRQWAKDEPDRLLAYLRDPESPPTRLTFAAEVAGDSLQTPEVRDALLALTRHDKAVVREGAIIGLGNLDCECPPEVTVDRVRAMAKFDVSPGVRSAAEGYLDQFGMVTVLP